MVPPSLLVHAEALERGAAADRVAYLRDSGVDGSWILDVGCGNGYAVAEWITQGRKAIGVDASPYRFSRWITEHPSSRPFVLASALALPFRSCCFDHSVSSGLLEHIGVSEASDPYRVTALPDKHPSRAAAIGELLRVLRRGGSATLDFPNGWFPVDFWHGDRVGAFRLHRLPDPLNPSLRELRRYAPSAPLSVLPLRSRLRFLQVRTRWWGRLLALPVQAFLRLLDRLPRWAATPLSAVFSPYLVIRYERVGA